MYCKLVGVRLDGLFMLTHFLVFQFSCGTIGLVSDRYPCQRFSEFAVMLQFRVSSDADLNSTTR